MTPEPLIISGAMTNNLIAAYGAGKRRTPAAVKEERNGKETFGSRHGCHDGRRRGHHRHRSRIHAPGAANAELQAFKVNGETVSVAQQKALYDSAVAQGQPAGAELERQVKNVLTQQTVLLQEAKKAKLDRNSDVKQAIEAARNQVLINAVLRDWAKKNPVKDEDVRKAYEAEKAAYGPTEYQVRHILVKTEDQAKNIISRLNKGADFDKLAKEFSEDRGNKDRGGQLGWVVPRSFVPTFGNAFAGMKEGTVSKEPVRTQFGFHVVKLDAKRPAQLFPTFEAQKPALVNALTNQRVNQHFGELVKNAKVQ